MIILFLKCRKPINKEILERYKKIQIIDSRNLLCEEHLRYAIEQAKKAFERNQNISKDFFIEIVVRASAQNQIKKAFEIFGLRNSYEVAVFGEEIPEELIKEYGCKEMKITPDEERLRRVKKVFNITAEEIASRKLSEKEALLSIIRERMALAFAE